MKTTDTRDRRAQGFTLLEMLLVTAILIILIGLGGRGLYHAFRGRNTVIAGSMVEQQLSLARQIAISEGTRVEFQLIRLPDASQPGPGEFRLVRLRGFNPKTRDWTTRGTLLHLPTDVHVSVEGSSLLADESKLSPADDIPTPSGVISSQAAVITFLPNGGTNHDLNAKHNLTVRNIRNPGDFITLQVNPVTGKPRSFKP